MNYFTVSVILLISYVIGSIPVAYIFGKRVRGIDLREVGDGNTGARNAFHQLGSHYGYIIAALDILKGAVAILIARFAGLDTLWQMMAGAAAIVGNDFPMFAGFKGGQGLATSTGTMLALFPVPTAAGIAVYGMLYALLRRSIIGSSFGGGVVALLLALTGQWPQLIYAVCVFLFIPVKQQLDAPRRKAIAEMRGNASSQQPDHS